MPPPSDPTHGPAHDTSRRMLIRFEADDRFHGVVHSAVEIYMRPICGDDTLAPEIARELISALATAESGEPCEVMLACRRPELETTVTVGDQKTSRRWRVEEPRD